MLQTAVRITSIVESEGKLVISHPALHVGDEVEVLILLPVKQDETTRLSILDVLKSTEGHHLFKSAEEVDQYIRGERDSWDD